MEVKINKEIRNYTESIYFGLSVRQFAFSLLACVVAIVLYFVCKKHFNIEIVSWICILGVVPFVVLGFVKYNGMNAEEFILAFIKSEILTPRELLFKPVNYYYKLLNIDKELKSINEND